MEKLDADHSQGLKVNLTFFVSVTVCDESEQVPVLRGKIRLWGWIHYKKQLSFASFRVGENENYTKLLKLEIVRWTKKRFCHFLGKNIHPEGEKNLSLSPCVAKVKKLYSKTLLPNPSLLLSFRFQNFFLYSFSLRSFWFVFTKGEHKISNVEVKWIFFLCKELMSFYAKNS